jgi:integrase
MPVGNSTNALELRKPRADFPLWIHKGSRTTPARWAKRVRGRVHYFGHVAADPDGKKALDQWLDERDDLLAGRIPRKKSALGLTVNDLCNRFLTAKIHQRDAGEIKPRTFKEYKQTTDRIVELFGGNRVVSDIQSDDFEQLRARIARDNGPVALGNAIQRTRTVFKYAYDAGLIEAPIRFGPMFKRPSRKTLRLARKKAGVKLFTAAEIKRLLAGAGLQFKAMLLLAINAGFGNADCGTLPIAAVDLDVGWIDYARPKTGIDRRCPLWPATVKALKAVLAKRKAPKLDEHKHLFFVTKRGGTFAKESEDNPISKEFTKLAREVGVDQAGRGFYSLRHTFRTIADETKDFPACDLIMGHGDETMAARYREKVDDKRLKRVVEHVRKWVFRRERGAK